MVKLEVMGVSMDSTHQPVVLLRNEDRVLPIVVGIFEAEAIHAGLVSKDYGRPMTHDLIRNLLAGLRGTVQSVTIYKLENETFFAHVNIEQRSVNGQVEQVLRVDSRPSDGIAIACRTDAPILATQAVMDQASQDVSILSGNEESDDSEEQEFDS
ncbi:MAG: bifunctional nuclease family protein [Candidatus Hydrogenedentes bacterium]|nr:bifunctional nuclease family protein [Candidatus Hydrogenedentota bacterium]